jgi:predicted Mrr-cat superfamily restriction endonuclease
MSNVTDNESLNNIYYSVYKENKISGLQGISQIWLFLKKIRKNDIVILPRKIILFTLD